MTHIVKQNIEAPCGPVSQVLVDSSPWFEGRDLRLEILEFLPDDDLFAFSWTCHTFRKTSVDLTLYKGRKVAVPSFDHAVTSVAMFSWARSFGCPWDTSTCARAARGGNLEVLKWLRESGCPWDHWTCAWAILGRHLEVLKWDRGNRHIEVLKWACENGCPWDEMSSACACGCGCAFLRWLRRRDYPWSGMMRDDHACVFAAGGGHLGVLKWLRENGCPWESRTLVWAAGGGHLEVVKWAHEQGCPWDSRMRGAAVASKNIEMINWVRDNETP